MKKTIMILSVITVIGFTGCSRAEIEKESISVADDASLEKEIPSGTPEDVTANAEITKTPVAEDFEEEPEAVKEEMSEASREDAPKAEAPREDAGEGREAGSRDQVSDEVRAELREEAKPIPVIINMEGMKETMYGLWHSGDGYKIMYDVDRFEYSDKDRVDTFIAKNADPEIYPYVYVSVSHIENKSASDYTKDLTGRLSRKSIKPEIVTDISIGKYKGAALTVRDGSEWNSLIHNYYMIEDGTSLYIIEAQYFVEAEEGYSARIQAMLDSFEIQ